MRVAYGVAGLFQGNLNEVNIIREPYYVLHTHIMVT